MYMGHSCSLTYYTNNQKANCSVKDHKQHECNCFWHKQRAGCDDSLCGTGMWHTQALKDAS